ncbi:MAG TPA: hypothetical protein DIT07_04745 [Sphingobacteriaceae bacterium]|jgi:hypothetical protein|nr:hypothetical protein [Sphingobacteriaceae bacterium]
MKYKIAIIVFSDSQTHADMARVVNALQIIKEFADSGDDVRLLFDGAGVTWPPKLAKEDHPLHKIYEMVKPHVTGACAYCSRAFKVAEEVEKSGVVLMDEFNGHPSVRGLITEGYQVITL